MKTTITLTDNQRAPNMLKEPDGSIRVDSEIDIYSSKEGGVCLFFLGDSKQNFSIRLNHRDAKQLGIALGSHVEVCSDVPRIAKRRCSARGLDATTTQAAAGGVA